LPIGNILSEGASSPLISEKSPEVRKEAIQQIVKAQRGREEGLFGMHTAVGDLICISSGVKLQNKNLVA